MPRVSEDGEQLKCCTLLVKVQIGTTDFEKLAGYFHSSVYPTKVSLFVYLSVFIAALAINWNSLKV